MIVSGKHLQYRRYGTVSSVARSARHGKLCPCRELATLLDWYMYHLCATCVPPMCHPCNTLQHCRVAMARTKQTARSVNGGLSATPAAAASAANNTAHVRAKTRCKPRVAALREVRKYQKCVTGMPHCLLTGHGAVHSLSTTPCRVTGMPH